MAKDSEDYDKREPTQFPIVEYLYEYVKCLCKFYFAGNL